MSTIRRRLLPADHIDSSTEAYLEPIKPNELQQYAAFVCGAGQYYTHPIVQTWKERELRCCCFWTSTKKKVDPPLLSMILQHGISPKAFFSNEKIAFETARKKHPLTALTILTVNIKPSQLEKKSKKMVTIALENITKIVEYKASEMDPNNFIALKLPELENMPKTLLPHQKMT